ncbi:MAG: hypothetical protein QXF61_03055 [Nitrososphaeria archaeon]
MPQRKSLEYVIKQKVETERYLVVLFSTPLHGTWSVFIPKQELKSVKDLSKIEETIERKLVELKRETKGIKWVVGVPLYESDIKILLSLLLDGPCKSIYELFKIRKVCGRQTCYNAYNRLKERGFITKVEKIKVTFLGFCAVIKEQVEQVLENVDEIIAKNSHLLPLIFSHWDNFKSLENLKNEVWNRILEYIWFELDARLSLIRDRYPLLTLEEAEEILKNDLTRFIIFPWLHKSMNDLLFSKFYSVDKKHNNACEVPEDIKLSVENFNRLTKILERKHIKKWIITLSGYDDVKEFISKELVLLKQLFQKTIRTLNYCKKSFDRGLRKSCKESLGRREKGRNLS